MRDEPRPPWRALVAGALVLVTVGLAGCTSTTSGQPSTPPSAAVWMVGDSLATGTGYGMAYPRPYVAGYGAAGFTDGANTTVLANTLSLVDQFGAPRTVLALGGVNDLAINATVEQITSAMATFEQVMNDRGATVVWVLQPAWSREAQLQPVYAWQRTRSHAIDCLAYKGDHLWWDGDHPFDYLPFAACVADRLLAMPDVAVE